MREGVVADDVACIYDLAGDVRALLNVASDQKKSCVHLVLRENLQKAQGVGIVRAVVVGEREQFRPGREACEGAAVPLSGGRHGLVTSGNRGGSGGCGGEHGSEHGRILKDCRFQIGDFRFRKREYPRWRLCSSQQSDI